VTLQDCKEMDDNDRTEIYDLSLRCDKIFHRIAQDSRGRSAVIKVLHDRFHQWTTHLGVFARDAGRPRVSLDSRLKYSESLRGVVLQYLAITARNLHYSM